ncbi:hypothetical protein DICVIV_03942 [Dictyocaulus viviparus]|uniref:Uncharacterized protein n=1 Tax=Dictyocaulus viviparus TaxID=29172 RepID=A0A0D8Y187_DICVI|nr:hypothetical protein DICVIV_03942 [Dictyocaulus viviparus]
MKEYKCDIEYRTLIGVTPHCFVYYGWLHELVTVPSIDMQLRSKTKDGCRNFKPFIIRTEGLRFLLLIVAKRHGRKILVQSIAKKKYLSSSNQSSVIWMRFDPYLRHMQFLSNQFPVGFVFQMLQNLNYRIYVLGYTSSNTVILELKIHIDSNYNLVPFITKNVLIVDPVIHAPIYGSWIIPAHEFKRGNTLTDGFIFVRQIYEDGLPKNRSYITFGVPMVSLVLNSITGARRIPSYDGYVYKSNYFKTYTNPFCSVDIGNYMIYTEYSYMNWTANTLPTAEFNLAKISSRVWLNNLRYHRRMSYPHAYHKVERHQIFLSWVKAFPAILGTFAVMSSILFGIEYAVRYHERSLARSAGLSRSHSASSF